jgi:nitrogenase iron protein NifH
MMAKTIALYGKGGVGKTTIAANLAAALAGAGRVLLIGCSPTADSSHLLIGEAVPVPLYSFLRKGGKTAPEELITTGYQGVGCIEIGEPPGGCGCSSRSLASAIDKIVETGVIDEFAPEYVIYDMPGDPGCLGELALEKRGADISLIVTSADFQALYAANRLISFLKRGTDKSRLVLVANGSVSSFEDSFVDDFANKTGLAVAAAIPRSFAVRHSELYGKTVIEAGPLSSHAYAYRGLARQITENGFSQNCGKTEPLDAAALKEWAHEWGRRLGELEFGILTDGAGI